MTIRMGEVQSYAEALLVVFDVGFPCSIVPAHNHKRASQAEHVDDNFKLKVKEAIFASPINTIAIIRDMKDDTVTNNQDPKLED